MFQYGTLDGANVLRNGGYECAWPDMTPCRESVARLFEAVGTGVRDAQSLHQASSWCIPRLWAGRRARIHTGRCSENIGCELSLFL